MSKKARKITSLLVIAMMVLCTPFSSIAESIEMTQQINESVPQSYSRDDELAFFNNATPADLLNLRDQINDALFTSPDYESVSVPSGIYQVGVDIPAGKWTLSTSVKSDMSIGASLKDNGKEVVTFSGPYYATSSQLTFLNTWLYSSNSYISSVSQTVDFPEDSFVAIQKGTVVFSTYIGQPDFLFYASTLPDNEIKTELDISEYAFQDLINLRKQMNIRLWNSYNWDRVLVPAGLYLIDEDIPTGHWDIESPEDYTRICYGTKLSERNLNLQIYDAWQQEIINPNYSHFKEGEDVSSVDLDVASGNYLSINENTCAAFSPSAQRKNSLGFKAFANNDEDEAESSVAEKDLHLFSLQSDPLIDNFSASATGEVRTSSQAPNVFDGKYYDLIDYAGIARNPSSYTGKGIYFFGEVIQVSEAASGNNTIYRIRLEDSSDIVLVHKYFNSEPRILNNDHVLVYGTCNGVESYQSVLGGQITIPSCTAIEIRDSSKLPRRKDDPIKILSCVVGKEANITVQNASGETITEFGFRVRYYNADGSLQFADGNVFSEVGYDANAAVISAQGVFEPDQNIVLECGTSSQFQNASKIEVAFQYYVTSNNDLYAVPEHYLLWFSSESGSYINSNMLEYYYEIPDQKIIQDSMKFMLGLYNTTIYPEYKEHYGFDEAGSYIVSIDTGSIFDQLGVKPGDMIITCDNISYYEDDYTLDKAKARIINGNSSDIELSRNGERYTITITPEMAMTALVDEE